MPDVTKLRRAALLAAAAAIGFGVRPGLAQLPPWQQACVAIQPTLPCTAQNRPAVEAAIELCRNSEDKPACHRRYLTERQERPAGPPPTILRGGRSK